MANNPDWMRNYARYSAIVFQMIVIVLGGVFLGYKTDQWLNMQKPLFLIGFSILSGVLAMYLMIKDLTKMK